MTATAATSLLRRHGKETLLVEAWGPHSVWVRGTAVYRNLRDVSARPGLLRRRAGMVARGP